MIIQGKILLIASTTTEMTALQRPAHSQSVFLPFFFHPAHALISVGGDDDEEEEKERVEMFAFHPPPPPLKMKFYIEVARSRQEVA